MNEDRISRAWMVARTYTSDPNELKTKALNLANAGEDVLNDLFAKRVVAGSRNGAPATTALDRSGNTKTEEEILETIEKATPFQRRTLRHIQKMRKNNIVPIIGGVLRP
jgi:hypothetical protein